MINDKQLTPEEILNNNFINPSTQDWFVPVVEIMKKYADQEKRPFQQELFNIKSIIKKLWDNGFDMDCLNKVERQQIDNIVI